MIFSETDLTGAYVIDIEPRKDDRGFFARLFCEHEFAAQGLNTRWVQINNSFTTETGTLRGLHFQRPPKAEVKVVRCIRGVIWDVIVDLRASSTTFGKWFGTELNAENRTMLYVPQGFAHGFISLQPNSEILYLVSEFYGPEQEETLLWNDSAVDIAWLIDPKYISNKDKQAKQLSDIKPIKI